MLILNQKFGKYVSISLSIILIFVGLIQLQKKQLSQLRAFEEKSNYLEEEEYLKTRVKFQKKMPVFGFDNLFADWNYLQFVQYFGDGEARQVTGYSLVTDYFEDIVNRDPNFIQSQLVMSTANSLFAARPEKTIDLINQALETVNPKNPYYPFFLWTYKATDEILFLGDIEAAKNSYKMASKWASLRQDDLGNKMADRFQNTAKFLATGPDPTEAKFGAWMTVLSNSQDPKTQDYILNKLKELGAEINISPDGRLDIKPPKLDRA
ncbi:hypothetical protein [Pleurocapsa sp. PCC 7319]|uniref:hypothetical protein n=1 Tax=Pleurocapsa sp. PCC 7319 TaxID=118161 RepID=UPI000345D4E0|nr:hypothetical protein [Pleurocapsa sp. PCC 7319]